MNHDAGEAGGSRADKGPGWQPGSTGGGVCATCGSTLDLSGPEGGCLNCLAQFALSPGQDGFDETDDDRSVHSFGHFEIVSDPNGWPVRLGRGAMGVTYRARDTVLRTEVALKVISGNVAGHPSARAGFLREARAAARLRHPNVASVFHYGEQDGQCFYVMELVEGETLEARLRRAGPLPPVLVLEVGRQVACALMEAEALGMVHRDLKPSNIMFVARRGDASDDPPHIKVIDFGLAQAVDLAGAEEGPDEAAYGFVGTPAFASPEQFARDGAPRVDTRSDMYSLGVTLWYLLCGRLPFDGSTLTSLQAQQARASLPVAQLRAARTPAPVVALLETMLKADPAERPRSARVLVDEIQRCQSKIAPAQPAGSRRSWWTLIFTLLTLGALAVVLFREEREKHDSASRAPSVPADPSVAVLPFTNRSPDAKDAYFTRGIHDAVGGDLARIARLKVVSGDSIKPYSPDKPRDLPAIGKALGVSHLVEGSVRREGDRVQVEVRLVDPHEPARNWTARYDRPLTEEFALLGEITRAVAERMGVPPTAAETAVIDRQPTHDPVAYDLYLRTREKPSVFQSSVELRQARRNEIPLLNEALARDPGFTLAWCELAAVYREIAVHLDGATAEELAVDYRGLAEAALAKARQLQPDAGEVHLARANYEISFTHDLEKARHEADLALRSLPNYVPVLTTVSRVGKLQGRWEDAARALEKAAALDPRNLGVHGELEELYVNLRRYEGARHELDVVESMLPPQAVVTFPAARAMLTLEGHADLVPLRAAVAAVTDAQDPDHEVRDGYGLILALFDHNESRLRYVLAAAKDSNLTIGEFTYSKAWFEALAARMRGDIPAARAAFTIARGEAEKALQVNPRNERNLLLLAMIDAGLGRTEDAVAEAKRACAMTPYEVERLLGPSDRCCLAVVYAWTNQTELALAELEKLVAGPAGDNQPSQPTYGDLRLNPLWEPLRNEPRFTALTEKLAPRLTP